MTATVQHIYTCPRRGAEMVSHSSIRVVWRSGVVGDRWFRGWWLWPLRWLNAKRKRMPVGVTSVSLITMREIEEANKFLVDRGEEPLSPLEMRRNIVLAGDVDLNSLVGVEFSIGPLRLKGDNLCTPCALPPQRGKKKTTTKDFLVAFGHPKFQGVNRGGLRAQVLNSATVKIGYPLWIS